MAELDEDLYDNADCKLRYEAYRLLTLPRLTLPLGHHEEGNDLLEIRIV